MNPKIAEALRKLDHGGWSLTVDGFARRAFGWRQPLTGRQREQLRRAMHASGLPHRRVPGPTMGERTDVWDYEAA